MMKIAQLFVVFMMIAMTFAAECNPDISPLCNCSGNGLKDGSQGGDTRVCKNSAD